MPYSLMYIWKPELNVVVDSVTEALQTINLPPHLFRFENDRSVYLMIRQTVSGRSLTREIFYEIVNAYPIFRRISTK